MNKVVNYDVGEFPTGLKILLVDDDRTCLFVLERMLRKLLYQVTKCQLAREALALLRQDKNRFDIVLCDLHMPDMDGFKLLQIIELEMDLPVVMMSADDGKGVVMKGIIYGACDYLLKPVRMETVRLIWQHVVRKKKRILGEFQRLAGNINVDDRILLLEQAKDVAVSNQLPSKDKRILQILQRTREDEDVDNNGESDCELTIGKKTRVIWTPQLHDMFVAAINQIGLDNAVPKKILERMREMNVTDLTRANIASHLQKYRLHLQKKSSRPRTDDKDLNANFDQASSFDNQYLQLQPTIASSQLPPQNIISSQSCSFERVNENVLSTAPSRHDQRIDILDSNIVSESSRCLPTDFSFYDPLAISNEECLYRNLGNGTEISNPLPAFDGLIYEPYFSVEQYDQEDFFLGPFE